MRLESVWIHLGILRTRGVESVWIHLGILRTRGGELAASCNLLYCFVASDASCGTLLGALVLERRYRSCCWTDWISPFIGCGTDDCIKYLQCATQACGYVLCTAVGGQSQSLIRRLSGSVLAIWGRLWNYAIGALGRPSQSSAAESSRQLVVCRPLVSG